ncbi:MAG: DUF106 domain-containing protein [archaeon]|nr:DUF106 domain-containing protein [archaeon]
MILQLETIPATPDQYIQILLITIGIFLLSRFFNKKFGIDRAQQMESQIRNQELQEDLRVATKNGDMEEAQRIQIELMEIMQNMMKKQMLPMCFRSLIFIAFFGILGFIYTGIDFFDFPILIFGKGAMGLYFLYSIGLSLLLLVFRRLRSSLNPEEEKKELIDVKTALKSSSGGFSTIKGMSNEIIEYKRQLEEKQRNGQLPPDININDEVKKMIRDNIDNQAQKMTKQPQIQPKQSNKEWKKKISQSSTINLPDASDSKKDWKKKIDS